MMATFYINQNGVLFHRRAQATADIKEMEAAEMRKTLLPRLVYKQHVAAHITAIRQNILPLATNVAPQLEGLNRSKIKELLHKRHCEVLSRLATGADVKVILGDPGGKEIS